MKNYNRPVFLLFLIFVCSIRLHAQQPTLLDAVKNNDIKQVKLLLDKGENPNAYDDDSDNVLINATLFASIDCMKLLLENKADPNLKNKYGENIPSMISAITGPSRSADIEKTLVMGAHGPKEVFVFLIDDNN